MAQQHQRTGEASLPISSRSSVEVPAKAAGLVRSLAGFALRGPFAPSEPQVIPEGMSLAAAQTETAKQAESRRYEEASALLPAPPAMPSPPRGVFLHGSVRSPALQIYDVLIFGGTVSVV